jgi:transposase
MQVQVSLTIEIAASASLSEMEQQVQEIGQQAMREAFKQAIRQWEDQQQACPHCGAKQRRLEGTVRRVIATLFGRVQVPRRRFRCQGCGRRWCPANGLLAEMKGGTISVPLQEAAMLAGCSWPYRAASAALKRLSGADISAARCCSIGRGSSERHSSKSRHSVSVRSQFSHREQPRTGSSGCWWA